MTDDKKKNKNSYVETRILFEIRSMRDEQYVPIIKLLHKMGKGRLGTYPFCLLQIIFEMTLEFIIHVHQYNVFTRTNIF